MSEPHSFEFELRLRPVPGNWSTPAVQRLRILLKVALRGFGLRAVECRPVLLAPAQPQDVPQAIQRTTAVNPSSSGEHKRESAERQANA